MKKHHQDPFARREAQKYDNPIYSREFILDHIKTLNRLVSHAELAASLNLTNEDDIEALRRRLKAMQRDGQIMQNRRGCYGLAAEMELICGQILAHRDGYGFVRPDDGSTDLFLHAKYMRAVFHGDKVLVRVLSSNQSTRREGILVEVVARSIQFLPGRITIEAGVAFLTPSDKKLTQDIVVPLDALHGAQHGQMVVVELIAYPTMTQRSVGKVVEILGEHMAPGMEADLAIRTYGIPHIFPQEVQEELQYIPAEVTPAEQQGRVDLRHLPFITIDGEDAKDFDDAVCCDMNEKGHWKLWVAIADVSHYVREHSALDQEAQHRGNSVYFPTKVIPMLPEKLSNELCSLKPSVDRLALVCEITLSPKGATTKYRFLEGVIRSVQRFTYHTVAAILDENPQLSTEFADRVPMLRQLHKLYQLLLKNRIARGAIEFDSSETKILFDRFDKIKEIVVVERNDAHRLIEECMLLANVCAADFLLKNKIPAIYRIHAGPKRDTLDTLRVTLQRFGFSLGGAKTPQPKHYAKLLQQARTSRYYQLLSMTLLRSLNQAVYSTDDQDGHFGLAYDAYTHFTSPIRRYPDLIVHRLIRHLLQQKENTLYSSVQLNVICGHCSVTERRADDATREAVDWLKCEYMLDKVGSDYVGVIVGVTSFGLFVRLHDVYVEGLVHISNLANDYYQFDEEHFTLTGKRSGICYALTDEVTVRVANVDLANRSIDFHLLSPLPKAVKATPKPPKAVRQKAAKVKKRARSATKKTSE